ncbi:MAG: hypothetical protein M1838_003231 [Thelocarpon superellum]|nr:MAG: hypothetical protein M1838_003231 [Thelocarpon superellum]
MSNADSEGSPTRPLPSTSTVTHSLQETVRELFRAGGGENLTIKQVRTAVEDKLRLPHGYFKEHGEWKVKSKEIIEGAFATADAPKSPSKAPEGTAPRTELPAPGRASLAQRGKQSVDHSRKRRKIEVLSDEDVDAESVDPPPVITSMGRPSKKPPKHGTTDAGSRSEPSRVAPPPLPLARDTSSDSELSILMDDDAPKKPNAPRRRSVKATTSGPAKKSLTATASSKKDAPVLEPQEAEIKRLQSWLLKCGVRKLWHRELAACSTPASKIKHLKDMLKDVGIEGRFSVEKARKIKEERELQAEVAAIQASNQRWGEAGDDEDEDDDDAAAEKPRPHRRLARGLQELDFLGDDGEETD